MTRAMTGPVMSALAMGAAAAMVLSGCASVQAARGRLVKTPPRCVDQTVQIYFSAEQAELTPEGRSVIGQAATMARGCKVRAVEVMGLADAAGAPAANLELSRRRAQSVTAALTSAGLPAADFTVAAAGQAGSLTAEGRAAPLRRRADVTLRLSPP